MGSYQRKNFRHLITPNVDFPSQEEQGPINNEEELLRRHQTLLQPLTFDTWMLEAIADLTTPAPAYTSDNEPRHEVMRQSPVKDSYVHQRRPSSLCIEIPEAPVSAVERERKLQRLSLPFTPTSPAISTSSTANSRHVLSQKYGKDFEFGSSLDLYTIDEKTSLHGDPGYLFTSRTIEEAQRHSIVQGKRSSSHPRDTRHSYSPRSSKPNYTAIFLQDNLSGIFYSSL